MAMVEFNMTAQPVFEALSAEGSFEDDYDENFADTMQTSLNLHPKAGQKHVETFQHTHHETAHQAVQERLSSSLDNNGAAPQVFVRGGIDHDATWHQDHRESRALYNRAVGLELFQTSIKMHMKWGQNKESELRSDSDVARREHNRLVGFWLHEEAVRMALHLQESNQSGTPGSCASSLWIACDSHETESEEEFLDEIEFGIL
mmetsp:Transcript_14164/g.33546  ORF Transcript_14164/g.33546 Transcript_14164/m.33546 type:complete len:203 (+) Transcript_14164:82-690(+)|eukprot:824410-Rhodomonas_salina.3